MRLKSLCDANNISYEVMGKIKTDHYLIKDVSHILIYNDKTNIEPINIKYYKVKQSKYQVVGTQPIRSSILYPSKPSTNCITTPYDLRYIQSLFS